MNILPKKILNIKCYQVNNYKMILLLNLLNIFILIWTVVKQNKL